MPTSPLCSKHPAASPTTACIHIAEAVSHCSHTSLLPKEYQLLSGSQRTTVALCTACASRVRADSFAAGIPDSAWHRQLELRPICGSCLLALQPTVGPCTHPIVIADYNHPYAEIRGVSLLDLKATDLEGARSHFGISKLRCPSCGVLLGAVDLGARLQPGGDLHDPRFLL